MSGSAERWHLSEPPRLPVVVDERAMPMTRLEPEFEDGEAQRCVVEVVRRYLESIERQMSPPDELRRAFVDIVVAYSIRLQVNAEAWLTVSVPPDDLRAGGFEL